MQYNYKVLAVTQIKKYLLWNQASWVGIWNFVYYHFFCHIDPIISVEVKYAGTISGIYGMLCLKILNHLFELTFIEITHKINRCPNMWFLRAFVFRRQISLTYSAFLGENSSKHWHRRKKAQGFLQRKKQHIISFTIIHGAKNEARYSHISIN